MARYGWGESASEGPRDVDEGCLVGCHEVSCCCVVEVVVAVAGICAAAAAVVAITF